MSSRAAKSANRSCPIATGSSSASACSTTCERARSSESRRAIRQQQPARIVAVPVHAPRPARMRPHLARRARASSIQFLLDNAAKKGVEIRRGVRVLRSRLRRRPRRRRAAKVGRHAAANGSSTDTVIRAKVIVDAAGQQGVISAAPPLAIRAPTCRKTAIWGHFRGSRRDIIDNGVMTARASARNRTNPGSGTSRCRTTSSASASSAMPTIFCQGRGTPDEIFAEEVADCPVDRRATRRHRKSRRPRRRQRVLLHDRTRRRRRLGPRRRRLGIHRSALFLRRAVRPQIGPARRRLHHRRPQAPATPPARNSANGSPTSPSAPTGSASSSLPGTRGQFRVGRFIREYPQHHGNMTDILIGRIFDPEVGRHLRRPRPLARTNETGRRTSLALRSSRSRPLGPLTSDLLDLSPPPHAHRLHHGRSGRHVLRQLSARQHARRRAPGPRRRRHPHPHLHAAPHRRARRQHRRVFFGGINVYLQQKWSALPPHALVARSPARSSRPARHRSPSAPAASIPPSSAT